MKTLALMVIAVAVPVISLVIKKTDGGQENGYFYDGNDSHFYCILKMDGELTAMRSLNETICEIITRARHVFDILVHYENRTQEKFYACKRITFPEFVSANQTIVDPWYWYGHCLIVTPEDESLEDMKKSFSLPWYGYLILVLVILVTLFSMYKFRGILCWGIFDLRS